MVSDRRGFGERLKRHRERRGITLQQIANSSKVPASLFGGLEAGDCSRWPAGLYARAYVRAYAQAVGLDAAETVEEFATAFGATVKSEPLGTPPAAAVQGSSTLRLSLVEDSEISLAGLARRAGLAAADVLISVLIAAVAYQVIGEGVWPTVALVLTYFTVGRLISDDPLLYYVYLRIRSRSSAVAVDVAQADMAVADAASTAA
jgi:transcriptional regulator with XRE-family HTH domain